MLCTSAADKQSRNTTDGSQRTSLAVGAQKLHVIFQAACCACLALTLKSRNTANAS